MSTRSICLLILFVCAVVSLAPTASARTIDVKISYQLNGQCPTDIKVDVEKAQFSYWMHRVRFGFSWVEWEVVHPAGGSVGATWTIKQKSAQPSDYYQVCPQSLGFEGDRAKCNVANKFLGESGWDYMVIAEKTGCTIPPLDPEVILRNGKGKALFFAETVLVMLGFALGLAWLIGQIKKRQGT